MKFDLSKEGISFAILIDSLRDFFSSEEGKQIKNVNQVLIKLGYENYFQLLPSITDESIKANKLRGFRFTIDTDLDGYEIEIIKEDV